MPKFKVTAQKRTEKKKLRGMLVKGFTPGVIYDQTGASHNIKIASNEVQRMLESVKGTPLVDISIDGTEERTALISEVQNDLRTNTANHVSFLSLDPNKEAVFDVEIIATGESPAVRNNIGVLILNRTSLELRGLPKDIPSHLEADVSSLKEIGDSISVSDLKILSSLRFVHEKEKEFSVASIQPFQKTYEEEKLEEEAAAAAAAEAAGEVPVGEEGTVEGEGSAAPAEGVEEGEGASKDEKGKAGAKSDAVAPSQRDKEGKDQKKSK